LNGDLAKEVDAREIPPDWTDGFVSLDGVKQDDVKGEPAGRMIYVDGLVTRQKRIAEGTSCG
jgi:purine nucleoside permease